jgi:hypothetical protein
LVAEWVEPLTIEAAGGLITAGVLGVTNGARRGLRSESKVADDQWLYDPELAKHLSADINLALAAAPFARTFDGRALRAFLQADEMRSVARLVAAASISQSTEYDAELTAEVAALFELRFPGSEQAAREVGRLFVSGLRKSFDSALVGPGRKSRTQEHLANMLLAQLGHIRLELARSTSTGLSHKVFQAFLDDLRQALTERYRLLSPPGFGRTHRLPIADMYVPPPVKRDVPPRVQKTHVVPVAISPLEIGARCHRAVVLGDPGGGKSTLSQALAFHHATRAPGGAEGTLAVPIVLRDMAGKTDARGVLNYLTTFFRDNLAIKVPDGCIELALTSGTLFVIFDGLDELGGKAQRQTVVADVESFCARFPNAPVLVTSRVDGYDLAKLDPHVFSRWRISPFGEREVEAFAHRWFGQVAQIDELETGSLPNWDPTSRAEAFLRDSERVSDLRANPLLLSLMCGLYKQDGDLPSTRPAVYSRCAEMLFQTWDTSRGIATPFLYEDDLKRVLMHVALWILRDETLQGGVGRVQLHREISSYLNDHRYRSRDKAVAVAREIVEYTTGRAWVFADSHQDLEEERYRFTHQTFLEYFAACQLVRESGRPEKLLKALMKRLASGEWYVVAPLAVQILHESIEDGGDKLTEAAIARLLSTSPPGRSDEAGALLDLVMRYMEYVALRPSTLTKLVMACKTLFSSSLDHPPLSYDGFLLSIHSMHRDNRTGLLEALCDLRDELFDGESYLSSMIPLTGAVHFLAYGYGGEADAAAKSFLSQVAKMGDGDPAHTQLVKVYKQWDRGLITDDERVQETIETLIEAFESGYNLYFVDTDGEPITDRGRTIVAQHANGTTSDSD